MLDQTTTSLLLEGLGETVFMTFVSGFFGFFIGFTGRNYLIRYQERTISRKQDLQPGFIGFGECFPFHSLYYSDRMDDSVYTRVNRNFHRCLRGAGSFEHWRRSFYSPVG